jgi:hypothetical protein
MNNQPHAVKKLPKKGFNVLFWKVYNKILFKH